MFNKKWHALYIQGQRDGRLLQAERFEVSDKQVLKDLIVLYENAYGICDRIDIVVLP